MVMVQCTPDRSPPSMTRLLSPSGLSRLNRTTPSTLSSEIGEWRDRIGLSLQITNVPSGQNLTSCSCRSASQIARNWPVNVPVYQGGELVTSRTTTPNINLRSAKKTQRGRAASLAELETHQTAGRSPFYVWWHDWS